MKNLQTLANELAANKMTLLVSNDMLNVKGGWSNSGHGSKKNKSGKNRGSKKRGSNKGGGSRGHGGGYGGGCGYGW